MQNRENIYEIDPNRKLTKKIFYIPDITLLDIASGKVKTLEYIQPNGSVAEKFYASRVSPGQSLREAIQNDLAQDFGYEGGIDVSPQVTLVDINTDKKGKEVPRYEVILSPLDEFDIDSAKPLGCNLQWKEFDLLQTEDVGELELNQLINKELELSQQTTSKKQGEDSDESSPEGLKELTSEDLDKLKQTLQIQNIEVLDSEYITIETIDFKPKISVNSDWKWDDDYVFSQLKVVIPEASIEYDSGSRFQGDKHEAGFSNFEDYAQSLKETWQLTFKAFREEHSLSLDRLDLEALIRLINSLIEPKLQKKFINIETFGDFYLFILAPIDIDLKKFNEIIYDF